MQAFTIPVVDMRDFSASAELRERFVTAIGDALRDIGFFAITSHGLDSDEIARTYRLIAQLFELSDDQKRSYESPQLRGQRGYTSFGREHAKDHDAPDLKEFWHVGQESATSSETPDYPANIWPTEFTAFRPHMLSIYGRLEQCALELLSACSLYLGEAPDRLRSIAVGGNSILRLIHYPPLADDRDPRSVRAAPHEDINLITLLVEATDSGLEILSRQGKWVPVVTPKNCIIVDAGDMLQNITNGCFKSTTHRVVNPNQSNGRRYSMPFFVHARGEVALDPLASCVAKKDGTVHYPAITAGEYLHKRLVEIGLA